MSINTGWRAPDQVDFGEQRAWRRARVRQPPPDASDPASSATWLA
jgi:hypothetical protein